MHIGRQTGKNRNSQKLRILLLSVCACFLTGCAGEKQEAKTQEEMAGIFQSYNNSLGWDGRLDGVPTDVSGATSYDVREMAQQIEGFWEYYDTYQKELERLQAVIEEWETDFVPEGEYIVKQKQLQRLNWETDLPPEREYRVGSGLDPDGFYVYCDPDLELGESKTSDSEGTDLKNGRKKIYNPDSWDDYTYFTEAFGVTHLDEGDIICVKGSPKFAPLEDFPVLGPAEDGNYYGYDCWYTVGETIPAGRYFVLSLDTEQGKLDYLYDISNSGAVLYAKSRFSYVTLTEGDLFRMDKCVLIPIEQKPAISPIPHEDISYLNEPTTWWGVLSLWFEHYFPEKKSGETYDTPVYAEGEYIIGEDIPPGTYRIQNEVTAPVSDMEETALHSDFDAGYDHSWTGLHMFGMSETGEEEWSFVRTGYQGRYMQIREPDGTLEYRQIEDESLPEVTFDEEDAGNVVQVVRCLLIPEE